MCVFVTSRLVLLSRTLMRKFKPTHLPQHYFFLLLICYYIFHMCALFPCSSILLCQIVIKESFNSSRGLGHYINLVSPMSAEKRVFWNRIIHSIFFLGSVSVSPSFALIKLVWAFPPAIFSQRKERQFCLSTRQKLYHSFARLLQTETIKL